MSLCVYFMQMADKATVLTKSPKGPYKQLEELVAKNGLKVNKTKQIVEFN